MPIDPYIARGIAPVGADLPQIGNMLFQKQQAEARNALMAQQNAREADTLALQRDQFNAGQAKIQNEYMARSKLAEMESARATGPQGIAAYVAKQAQQHPEFAQTPFAQMPPDQAFEAMYRGLYTQINGKPPEAQKPGTLYQVDENGRPVYRDAAEAAGKPAWKAPQGSAEPSYSNVTLDDGTIGAFDRRTGRVLPTGAKGKPAGANNPATLRKEFNTLPEVKAYKETLPLITAAEKMPDTPAGDINLIYTFGKIMDPGSVVREGELALVLKSGTLLEQILGTTRFQLQGKGRLDPARRAQLLQTLRERVAQYQAQYDSARNQYTGYAQESGIAPEAVVGPHASAPFGGAAPTPPAPAPRAETPVVIEYDANGNRVQR